MRGVGSFYPVPPCPANRGASGHAAAAWPDLVSGTARRSVKVGGLVRHPCEETGDLRVGPKRFDVVQPTGEFRLAEPRMDRIVADPVQQHRRAAGATLRPRNQMVSRRAGIGRHRTAAKRADRWGVRHRSEVAGWARRDSNPQPSRYERPALTIELQARDLTLHIPKIGARGKPAPGPIAPGKPGCGHRPEPSRPRR